MQQLVRAMFYTLIYHKSRKLMFCFYSDVYTNGIIQVVVQD